MVDTVTTPWSPSAKKAEPTDGRAGGGVTAAAGAGNEGRRYTTPVTRMMVRAATRRGGKVTLLLAGLVPAECSECGAQYDPRTGEQLSVCGGFEVPGLNDAEA